MPIAKSHLWIKTSTSLSKVLNQAWPIRLSVLAANNSEKIILLRHVDDMLIIGTSSTQMELFLNRLKYEFAMIDLGQLHYFLGVKIDTMDSGLFLSRQRYATNLLLKAGLQDCKPISSPTAIKSHPPLLALLHFGIPLFLSRV